MITDGKFLFSPKAIEKNHIDLLKNKKSYKCSQERLLNTQITILKKLDENIMCENHFSDIYEELSIVMSSEFLLVSTFLLAFAVLMPFDRPGV